jgi:hypothetical protein
MDGCRQVDLVAADPQGLGERALVTRAAAIHLVPTGGLLGAAPAQAAFTAATLTNKLSNTCMDVPGRSNTPGTPRPARRS